MPYDVIQSSLDGVGWRGKGRCYWRGKGLLEGKGVVGRGKG